MTGPLVSSLKVLPDGCYGLHLNARGYTLNFFLNGKGGTIHIFGSTCDDDMGSSLSKESKCERHLMT